MKPTSGVDRTPHDIFVEMDELCGQEWQEQARWIKFEEDLLEGAERWGRAHISSLTFHSLINLRMVLERSKYQIMINKKLSQKNGKINYRCFGLGF